MRRSESGAGPSSKRAGNFLDAFAHPRTDVARLIARVATDIVHNVRLRARQPDNPNHATLPWR